tara:strand:+ start:470 stop:763 length:294 start_codon:yes stop_codon:yes gene_type:complete
MTNEKALDIVEKTINKLYEKIELLESKNQKLELDKTRLQHKLSLHVVGCSLTFKEVDKLLNTQKTNCRVAVMRYIKDNEILNKISNAPMYDYKKIHK